MNRNSPWMILLGAAVLVALLLGLLLLPSLRKPAGRRAAAPGARPSPEAAPGSSPAGPRATQGSTFWKMASGYEVVLDPYVEVECRVFQSPDYRGLLLLATQTDVAFLLDLSTRRVSTLPSSDVTPRVNGLILPNDVALTPAGTFEQRGADLWFRVGEGSVLISPQPPLVGEVTLEKLLQVKKEYAATAQAYTPEPTALATIRGCSRPTQIVVFFGTWCPHCRKYMPAFLRTMELARNPRFAVRYFAVDEEFTNPHDEIWKYDAHVAPTIILLRDGRELGRIKERPMKSIELDLAEILKNNP